MCSERMAPLSFPQSLKGALRVQGPSHSPWMQKGQEFKVCTPFSSRSYIPLLISLPCHAFELVCAVAYYCTGHTRW